MTLSEFHEHVSDTFFGEMISHQTLTRMEYYANVKASELFPEVANVKINLRGTSDIDMSFYFKSEQDYVWFKLKYQ